MMIRQMVVSLLIGGVFLSFTSRSPAIDPAPVPEKPLETPKDWNDLKGKWTVVSIEAHLGDADSAALDDLVVRLQRLSTRVSLLHESLADARP